MELNYRLETNMLRQQQHKKKKGLIQKRKGNGVQPT